MYITNAGKCWVRGATALVRALAPENHPHAVRLGGLSDGGKAVARSRTIRVVRLAVALVVSALALAIAPEAAHADAPDTGHHLYWAEACGPLGDCNNGTIGRADLTGQLPQAARVDDSFITSSAGPAFV